MRTLIICLFLFFSVSIGHTQQTTAFVDDPMLMFKKAVSNKQSGGTADKTLGFSMKPFNAFRHSILPNQSFKPVNSIVSTKLPENLVVQCFGAVCKMELKMQKQIKFPLYIRMGSKAYVDGMEGKNAAWSSFK